MSAAPQTNSVREAVCINCGCTDSKGCLTSTSSTCHWLQVDRDAGVGVCSACPGAMPRWNRRPKNRARLARARALA